MTCNNKNALKYGLWNDFIEFHVISGNLCCIANCDWDLRIKQKVLSFLERIKNKFILTVFC